MTTEIFGSYDQLVIAGRERIRIPLEEVASVSAAAAPSGRVLGRFGKPWHPRLVVELVDGGCYVVHHRNARSLAEDLTLRGVGRRRQLAKAGATS